MTGEWFGTFHYPNNEGTPNPFFARINERDGVLSGDISEPNLTGELGVYLYALLKGDRQGSNVIFVKTYDGQGDFAHAVIYDGKLNQTSEVVTGIWSFDGCAGTFEMRRELGREEMQEQRETVTACDPISRVST